MRGDYDDYRTPRRPPIDLDPPVFRSERKDWHALSEAEQLQVQLIREDLTDPAICSVRSREYLRRHGKAAA